MAKKPPLTKKQQEWWKGFASAHPERKLTSWRCQGGGYKELTFEWKEKSLTPLMAGYRQGESLAHCGMYLEISPKGVIRNQREWSHTRKTHGSLIAPRIHCGVEKRLDGFIRHQE